LQRVIAALVEAFEGAAGIDAVTDPEAGAAQADGRNFLEGEAQGMCRDPESPRAMGRGTLPVATEIKLGASLVVQRCHVFSCGPVIERCGASR
jgi:hypothetical protein